MARDPALLQVWEELVRLLRQRHAASSADPAWTAPGGPPAGLGSWADSEQDDSSAIVELVIDAKQFTVTVGQ